MAHLSGLQIGDPVTYHGTLREHHGKYVISRISIYSGRLALRGTEGSTRGKHLHDVSPRSVTLRTAMPFPYGAAR